MLKNTAFQHFIALNPIRVQLTEGIYLVKRKSDYPIIEHFGVLAVGRLLQQLGLPMEYPLVIHLTDRGIHVDWLETFGGWQLLGNVKQTEIPNALSRLRFAVCNPNWNLFSNNCEQWARYITEGYKQSIQLQNASIAALVIGAIVWANKA